jgi:hypothetical protein
VLHELVDTMIALGLRYTQTATDEGVYAFRLDPPIHQLLLPMPNAAAASSSSQGKLGGLAPSAVSQNLQSQQPSTGVSDGGGGLVRELPAAVRQLLGNEVQRELMRRHHALHSSGTSAHGAEGGSCGLTSSGAIPYGSPRIQPPSGRAALKPVAKPLPEKAKMNAEAMKPVEKRDMFGRAISEMARGRGVKRPASTLGKEAAESLHVRFKYHEGVTDAVRRAVKVCDLF